MVLAYPQAIWHEKWTKRIPSWVSCLTESDRHETNLELGMHSISTIQSIFCLPQTHLVPSILIPVATIPHHPPFDPLASVPKILSTDLSLLAPPLAVQKHPRFVGCFCTALMREGTSCVDFFARLFLDGSCLSSSNLTWKMNKTNSKLGFVPDWIRQARN